MMTLPSPTMKSTTLLLAIAFTALIAVATGSASFKAGVSVSAGKSGESSSSDDEAEVKVWVEANFKQKSGEDVDTYYRRVCSRGSISVELYVKRLTIARRLYPSLDLWYSDKYLTYTKEYYGSFYAKKESESEDVYFKRLCLKMEFETEINWAKRVYICHEIFPSLRLWSDQQCYNKYTKRVFQILFKKSSSESNEIYLKRVFRRTKGESKRCYWRRMKLIKTTYPKYSCWSDRKSLAKVEEVKSYSSVQSEEELKKAVESDKSCAECSEEQIEVLQTFYSKTTTETTSTSTTTEESGSVSVKKG